MLYSLAASTVLVDELAHTNAPTRVTPNGIKNIEELIQAGIDVIPR